MASGKAARVSLKKAAPGGPATRTEWLARSLFQSMAWPALAFTRRRASRTRGFDTGRADSKKIPCDSCSEAAGGGLGTAARAHGGAAAAPAPTAARMGRKLESLGRRRTWRPSAWSTHMRRCSADALLRCRRRRRRAAAVTVTAAAALSESLACRRYMRVSVGWRRNALRCLWSWRSGEEKRGARCANRRA